MATGIELIAQKRARQHDPHNYTVVHDVAENSEGQLGAMAMLLTLPDWSLEEFPFNDFMEHNLPNWDREYVTQLLQKNYIERLALSGAFAAAEIDRLLLVDQLQKTVPA
jgi:hypothetical protein